MELTRRAMLGALGGLAVGGTVASVVGTSIAADPKTKRFEQINGDFGWKPHKLDPKECAAVAYDGYWHKGLGCAYGAFYAIVGLMGEKYGAPYNQFPFAMLEVGKGGISDWGTICGALLDAFEAVTAYKIIFYILLGMLIMGFIMTLILLGIIKKEKKAQSVNAE